jgi:hypothetical protein
VEWDNCFLAGSQLANRSRRPLLRVSAAKVLGQCTEVLVSERLALFIFVPREERSNTWRGLCPQPKVYVRSPLSVVSCWVSSPFVRGKHNDAPRNLWHDGFAETSSGGLAWSVLSNGIGTA